MISLEGATLKQNKVGLRFCSNHTCTVSKQQKKRRTAARKDQSVLCSLSDTEASHVLYHCRHPIQFVQPIPKAVPKVQRNFTTPLQCLGVISAAWWGTQNRQRLAYLLASENGAPTPKLIPLAKKHPGSVVTAQQLPQFSKIYPSGLVTQSEQWNRKPRLTRSDLHLQRPTLTCCPEYGPVEGNAQARRLADKQLSQTACISDLNC